MVCTIIASDESRGSFHNVPGLNPICAEMKELLIWQVHSVKHLVIEAV